MTTTFDLSVIEREAIERRRYRRVRIALPVRWSTPDVAHGAWITAETVNAGAGGILVHTVMPDDIAEGATVCVTIDVGERRVTAVAEYCGGRGDLEVDGRQDIAFRFSAISRTDLRALVHALLAHDNA